MNSRNDLYKFPHSYYMEKGGNDFQNALLLYTANVRLAEALYPVLHTLEIALRNSINAQMTILKNDENWLWNMTGDARVARKIHNKKIENFTSDTIVGELTFGEWVTIFKVQVIDLNCRDLVKIFGKMRKEPNELVGKLERLNQFRNRVFHHDPILDNKLKDTYEDCCNLIKLLSSDRFTWCKTINRFSQVYAEIKSKLELAGIKIVL